MTELSPDLFGNTVFLSLNERLQHAADAHFDVFLQYFASQIDFGMG